MKFFNAFLSLSALAISGVSAAGLRKGGDPKNLIEAGRNEKNQDRLTRGKPKEVIHGRNLHYLSRSGHFCFDCTYEGDSSFQGNIVARSFDDYNNNVADWNPLEHCGPENCLALDPAEKAISLTIEGDDILVINYQTWDGQEIYKDASYCLGPTGVSHKDVECYESITFDSEGVIYRSLPTTTECPEEAPQNRDFCNLDTSKTCNYSPIYSDCNEFCGYSSFFSCGNGNTWQKASALVVCPECPASSGCWADGTECAAGAVCDNNCCNSWHWTGITGTCGESSCWESGTRCLGGTTCESNCCNSYEWSFGHFGHFCN